MSKILLYTVQDAKLTEVAIKDSKILDSISDKHGLTEYLGYRPIFCTKLDETSISESWFRVWATSPRYPEIIHIFEVDESECIPLNVIEWSNHCLSKKQSVAEHSNSIFCANNPSSTEYLIKKLPDEKLSIPVSALYTDTDCAKMLCDAFNIPSDDICNTIAEMQTEWHKMMDSGRLGSTSKTVTMLDLVYGSLCFTGLVPFLWHVATSVYTNNTAPLPIWTLEYATDILSESQFARAQELLVKWDKGIENGDTFSTDEFFEMRRCFIAALDQLAMDKMNQIPAELKLNRNDKCFCGSGKKLKQCHGRQMTMDDTIKSFL